MEAIVTLFWWGFLICLAIFIFKFVLLVVFYIIGGIGMLCVAIWETLFRQDRF